MRWTALFFAASFAPVTGCLMAEHTARNIFNEPTELIDNKRITKQLHRDSREVWKQVGSQYPGRTYSADFVEGFLAGYVDYLESGGTAAPPAVPPIRYRRSRFMNSEGHARIQDYFCGFKYGCDVAVVSGKRELITVPILLPEPPAETPVQARQVSMNKPGPRVAEPLPFPEPVESGPVEKKSEVHPMPVPNPASPLSVDAPTVAIPVVDPPMLSPNASPKFSAPTFDLPFGPRSELLPTDPICPVEYLPENPLPATGPIPPLREMPDGRVKPLRTPTDANPIPAYRGY